MDVDNWRLLFVRAQMGLLQEGILSDRLVGTVWGALSDVQSGYMRGVEDPLLVLYEVAAAMRAAGRCLFLLFGDFHEAFPRVWRQDLFHLLAHGPQVSGGCLHLLGSILELDIGGRSVVLVDQGLPEGGVIGTLAYTTLPDSFVKLLHAERCGISWPPVCPAPWSGRRWVGHGTP